MTANQHPFPSHIRDAVADAIADLYANATTWEQIESVDDQVADVALQSLWDASRINSREEFDALPDDAIVHSDNNLFTDFPARVIYWGGRR